MASSAYGFTGEQQDSSGKLVYLRARYYQSEAMRFASRDTWAGVARDPISLNKWVYGAASPIVYMDPSGNCYVPRDLLASALRFFESPMFGMCKAVKATTSQPTPARPTATPGTATPAAPAATFVPQASATPTFTQTPYITPSATPTRTPSATATIAPSLAKIGDMLCPGVDLVPSSLVANRNRQLTTEQLDVLALLVYGESSSGRVRLDVSELKIWALLNRINHYSVSKTVASIWKGAEGDLIAGDFGIPLDDDIALWAALVAKANSWRGLSGFADIRASVDRIYPLWLSSGSNSVADPTHGSVAFNDIPSCEDPDLPPNTPCLFLADKTDYDKVFEFRESRIDAWQWPQTHGRDDLNIVFSGIYVIDTDPWTGKPIFNFTVFGGCPDYTRPECPKSKH